MDGADSGSIFSDSSTRNITITNASSYTKTKTAGKYFGTAGASFDGTHAYLSMPASSFNLSTGDFTIDFWVYPMNINPSGGNIYMVSAGNSLDYLALIWATSIDNMGNLNFVACNISTTCFVNFSGAGGIILSNNQWYHVAFEKSGYNYYMYVNGYQDDTVYSTSTFPYKSSNPVLVGAWAQGGNHAAYFGGYIDELRISNVARWPGGTTGVQYFTPPTAPY